MVEAPLEGTMKIFAGRNCVRRFSLTIFSNYFLRRAIAAKAPAIIAITTAAAPIAITVVFTAPEWVVVVPGMLVVIVVAVPLIVVVMTVLVSTVLVTVVDEIIVEPVPELLVVVVVEVVVVSVVP